MVTTLWAGLSIGAVYALVAIAYNIVFIGTRVFNFAQAYILMICTFIAVEASAKFGIPLIPSIVICTIVGALIGAIEEIVAVRRLASTGSHNELVTTLGVGVILSGIALLVWGSEPRSVPYLKEFGVLEVLGGRVTMGEIALIVVALVAGLGTWLLSTRTSIGLTALATSEDRDAAMLRGINVRWLSTGAFALAGALVGAVAPLVASKTYATYHLGEGLAVKAFLVLALGGFGSFLGALLAGSIVGVLEMFAARYLGSEWQNITVFVMLLLVLLILPHGLFSRGKAQERVV
ncbi:branched-chain amino acid ABC transporter permease [Agromyces aerolatus]|uniref:branched-chain amino acid ABC transporter permease n=1 Tax=Agromyces sp. LY-1074 TaxID=3074080 RepID=UPI00285746D5|nr:MULTISPECIES: branched-chain amino acid ABC transporter permease [unclassified Agromyces]MDR5699435.1 branched-chain amino acid ABC transporter permease [Agromyces sp. LY-1074]MDR5705731.1 branched-chain amino acid ABC transporter permease [Agromyces sp. LY-1358]